MADTASGNTFSGDRRELLCSILPLYHDHQAAGTVRHFWPIAVERYLEKFPQDDIPEAQYIGTKTKSGKLSKKKVPGQQIGICEVFISSPLFAGSS